MVTDRQLELLTLIVNMYVRTGDPVSSGSLLEHNIDLNLSSATIRNEMVELEKEGYIIKSDSSSSRTSGRIPTKKGYEYFLKNVKTNPDSIVAIKKKLDTVLKNRKENIDNVLKEAMKLINESTNTLTISKDDSRDYRLQDINCYPTQEGKALVILITNSGEVINNEIELNGIEYSEFEKAIKVFAKRLNGTSIEELKDSSNSLKEILSLQIQGMEDKFQEIIKLMFSKLESGQAQYSGMNSLVVANDLDVKTQVQAIFTMIENNSIWELLDNDSSIKTETSGITVDMDIIDGVSVVKKSIDLGLKNKQLTIVGSKNQDYEKLFTMLEYLEDKLKGG